MRLHFDFSEYENDEDGTSVLLTVTIPDGSPHSQVTEIYQKALSILYGYDIGTELQSSFQFSFDYDDDFKACDKCVQGTCVHGCGKEFK
jgi:hypothetical protein